MEELIDDYWSDNCIQFDGAYCAEGMEYDKVFELCKLVRKQALEQAIDNLEQLKDAYNNSK